MKTKKEIYDTLAGIKQTGLKAKSGDKWHKVIGITNSTRMVVLESDGALFLEYPIAIQDVEEE
jgi:hypothetical protein